jgi:hypothetical protein
VGLAAVSAVAVTNRSLADRLFVELNGSQDKRGTDAVEA